MEKPTSFRERYRHFEPIVFFTAGFLFDVITLRRIDDWLKLIFQILFIVLLGFFLFFQYRQAQRSQPPPKWLGRVWKYQIEIVHFLFGSLLSAYVIFYFKSASFTRSVVFLSLLVMLMILNEIPKIRRFGVRLRVALYGFCLASFLIYFLPVLAGYISTFLFIAAIVLAALLTALLVWICTLGEDPKQQNMNRARLALPAFAIQLLLLGCYWLKIIPPVPISMTFGGIYHKIEREKTGVISLYSMKPWYNFWSHGDSHFLARNGEPVYCFVRIYAPANFTHKIVLEWFLYDDRQGRYVSQDKIPMDIKGGREEGFRGFAFKAHYQPGEWRVNVETSDQRTIGQIYFTLENDTSTEDRVYMIEEG